MFGQAGDLRRGLVSLSDGIVLSNNGLQTSRKYRKRCEDENRMSSFITASLFSLSKVENDLIDLNLYKILIGNSWKVSSVKGDGFFLRSPKALILFVFFVPPALFLTYTS